MALAQLIKDAGLRQLFVAQQLGMKRSHFNRVCHGAELPASRVADLARIMRLPIETVVAALTPQEDTQHGTSLEEPAGTLEPGGSATGPADSG